MTDYDTVLSTLGRQEADAWARLAAQYQLAADWDLDAALLDGCLRRGRPAIASSAWPTSSP